MHRMAAVGALACAMLTACTAKDGAPGAAGTPGAQGDAGPQGPQGPVGAQGPVGPKGDTGAQGPAGIQGPAGGQGLPGITGALGLVWRGAWSALDSYAKGDAVEHAGSAFVATTNTSGLPPPSADWQLLAARGSDGAQGGVGPTGPQGPQGSPGLAGADGVSVATASLAPGHAVCTYGGTLVQSSTGDRYVCNGAPGAAGTSVSAVALVPGADAACPAGGTRFTTGSVVTYACNATETGPCGPGKSLCGSTCIDLANDANNCGACGSICNSRACFSGSCAKLVFVTGTSYDGNLGGVAGADARCQARAAAAGLPGIFKAWISDSAGNSPAVTFARSTAPYVNRSGAVVAYSWTELISGSLRAAINLDESGNRVGDPVWTGTAFTGFAVTAFTCSGWTTTTGEGMRASPYDTNAGWTEGTYTACTTPFHLYCFEQ